MADEIKRTFGEKIGGSRYDVWHAGDILTLDDCDQMTEAQRSRNVTKDHVWPKPDYEAMKEEGMDPTVIYYRKLVRDSLPAKANKTNAVEQYTDFIKLVSHARDAMERVKSKSDMDRESGEFGWLDNEGFVENVYGNYYRSANIYLTTKILRAVKEGQRPYKVEMERKKKGFLMTKEEKLLSDHSFIPMVPGKMSVEPTRGGNKLCVRYEPVHGSVRYLYPMSGVNMEDLKKQLSEVKDIFHPPFLVAESYYIKSFGFPTKDLAEEWVIANAPEETKTTRTGKKRYTPKALEHIEQSDHSIPILCMDKTGDDLIETFGFRGGEFGEYESQNDRQENLNMCYTAFSNLAKALSIAPTDVSLGKQLFIAFGARGRGGAMAHFEPVLNVINLTKLKGAGSLGHEWIHALDYAIGQTLPNYYEKPALGRMATDLPTGQLRRDGYPALADLIDGLRFKEGFHTTEFYDNARKLDNVYQKDNGRYWTSPAELLARAGAAYLLDKCRELDIRDDYLCGHAEGEQIAPQGEERRTIDHLFDNALQEWKEKGLLHDETRETDLERE